MRDATLQRISEARASLVLDHPFYGALTLKLQPIEADASVTESAAADGRAFFFSREYIDNLPHDQRVTLFAHEAMHCALGHHVRRGDRDPSLWNVACDHAVNLLLEESKFEPLSDWQCDARYRGMSAEQIYSTLHQEQSQGGKGGNDQGGGVSKMPGAVLDAPEPALDAADWQVAVKQATQAAKMMGRMPGNVALEVAEQTAPKVDWRSLLRRFVQQTAAADYSWRMPNRRYIGQGIYLPALRSESLPSIVVAVDTSGSVGAAELASFSAEIQSIVDECQPEATIVIYCDSSVAGVDRFERNEPVAINARGGGGTAFGPVFDHVDSEQIEPACLIYLTDGYGRFPESPPDYPTLWAMTTDRVAPWGETVRIEN